MAEAAAADEKPKEQFDVMCTVTENLDDIKDTMAAWRKRGDDKKEGDWIMLTVQPEKGKKNRETLFTWIVHPKNPGKGGPEVACRAAYAALMHGTALDIRGDFWAEKKNDERKAGLEKNPIEWPVLKFPNGTTPIPITPEDSDEEEESDYVQLYQGVLTFIAVRYKDEVYTADTLTDSPGAVSGKTKMAWTHKKQEMLQSLNIQPDRHLGLLDEIKLSNGLQLFKECWKKNKNKI